MTHNTSNVEQNWPSQFVHKFEFITQLEFFQYKFLNLYRSSIFENDPFQCNLWIYNPTHSLDLTLHLVTQLELRKFLWFRADTAELQYHRFLRQTVLPAMFPQAFVGTLSALGCDHKAFEVNGMFGVFGFSISCFRVVNIPPLVLCMHLGSVYGILSCNFRCFIVLPHVLALKQSSLDVLLYLYVFLFVLFCFY